MVTCWRTRNASFCRFCWVEENGETLAKIQLLQNSIELFLTTDIIDAKAAILVMRNYDWLDDHDKPKGTQNFVHDLR